MPKNKTKITKGQQWLKLTQSLIKKKPREFVAGLITFGFILFFGSYFAFRLYQQKPVDKIKVKTPVENISPTPETTKYYQMKEGESLWDVSQREYGNPYLYPTLVELNNLSSPDLVEPGMKIRIR